MLDFTRIIKQSERFAVLTALIIPLILIAFIKQNSIAAILLFLAFCVSFLIQRFRLTKGLFLLLLATTLFGLDFPLLGGSEITLPSEPLAALLFFTVLLEFYFDKEQLYKVLKHPIALNLMSLMLVWIISSLFSSMVLVSFKYVIVNCVFLVSAVGGTYILLTKYNLNFRTTYLISSVAVLFFSFFSVYNLLPYQFNPGAAPLIGKPFFKDHTVFSASLSLFVFPFLLWPLYNPKSPRNYLFTSIGIFLLISLFISSSRAAWISIIISSLFIGFVYLGGRLIHLLFIGIGIFLLIWLNQKSIENTFLVNPYSSNELGGNLQDQALSVTNVNSDVSNIERLNRWRCALRMGMDRPLTGFGPGTYQFQYLVYQREAEMTYISVTDPFNTVLGRGGSAHSEYLLLLSESGIFGLICWISLQILLLIIFFQIWNSSLPTIEKNLSLVIYASLLTYSIHSLFNNYLGNAAFSLTYWMAFGGLLYFAIRAKEAHLHE